MSMPQQIAWFATRPEADAFEQKMRAQARENGQQCERWAEVIEDKALGFGVPVKDRVKIAVSADEQAKIVEWSATEQVVVSGFVEKP